MLLTNVKKKLMKNYKLSHFVLTLMCIPLLISWGIYGHEHINRSAVMALPLPLQQFFYNHIDFITLESTVPDLRKYTLNDKNEFPRHFINLEKFSGQPLPGTMAELRKAYPDSFLQKNGILPWYIQEIMDKLTKAFREKQKTAILFLAADLGHYIADAHMPLHTSVNHNGQLTGQKGIHAFWEAQLPEMFGETYNYYTGDAKYINDVKAETWRIISASHLLADTLLIADRELRKKFYDKNIFATDSTGGAIKNKFSDQVYTKAYALQYNKALNGMVEKQLRAAIAATANFWYTAWINAGKPDLTELDPKEVTKNNAILLQKEVNFWRKGKVYGIRSDPEF